MKTIVAAGHICIDLIPNFGRRAETFAELLQPGALVYTGNMEVSPGGSAANVGMALARLGAEVNIIARIGNDALGDLLQGEITKGAPSAHLHLVRAKDIGTSYSVVLSSPIEDRIFLHHPGANDTFTAQDVPDEALQEATIFHFGYPPLMAAMHAHEGTETFDLLQRARQAGAVTSLDMAMPDYNSPAGAVEWPKFFAGVLTQVDIFAPSFDEYALMLGMKRPQGIASARSLAAFALICGVAIVVIKLGDAGLYIRTTNEEQRLMPLAHALGIDVHEWYDIELYEPCFEAKFIGATGSGDSTIAGLLDALSQGWGPRDVARFATAVGACSVESATATGSIPNRAAIMQRMKDGWKKKAPAYEILPEHDID